MKKDIYKTNDGILKLQFIGWEEPNNGRELLIPKITKNEVEITQEICKNWDGWNRIPMYIDFDFSHDKLPIVFIPFEKKFILYNYEKNKISIIDLSSTLNNNRFVKNKFYDEYILFVSSRLIKIMNLFTDEYYKINANDNEFFKDVEITENNHLQIEIRIIERIENKIHNIVDKIILMDFKNVV
jgi:hypothetical protein